MKKGCFVLSGVLMILTLLVGCVAYVPGPQPYEVYAPAPPPESLVEAVPAIPYPEAVWIGGYWAYHGGNWGWRNGYWGRRPRAGAIWEPGRWHNEGPRGWGWRPGHWR